MTDKFRGRKLFVTNCPTGHSHYLILTTVTSISNYSSPFKERVDGRQILWQKIVCQKLCQCMTATKLSKHQYILRYPFETTFNNISTDVSTFIRDTFTQHRNTQPNRNFPGQLPIQHFSIHYSKQ
jgi:hypothetical protein